MMPQWRLRDPGSFPPAYHEAMRQGEGVDKVVARVYTEKSVRHHQTMFQLFRFSLRNYPGYALHEVEVSLQHRARVAWNYDLRMWELLLTSRKSVMQDVSAMH